jgi:hypothetical protein
MNAKLRRLKRVLQRRQAEAPVVKMHNVLPDLMTAEDDAARAGRHVSVSPKPAAVRRV